MFKTLIDAVGQNPSPQQTQLTSTFQPSIAGHFGRLSVVVFQLLVPSAAKNGVIFQAQGSVDEKTFGNLVHRRLDDNTVNAAPTYLPSPNPYLLVIEQVGLLAAVRFQYKTAGAADPTDVCILLGPDRN